MPRFRREVEQEQVKGMAETDAPAMLVAEALMLRQIGELCAAYPGVETGGLIFSGDAGGVITGPGPGALCKATALEWDAPYVAGCIDTAAALGCTIIGRWHKHTSPVLIASALDRESAHSLRRALELDHVVDVIVACGSDDEPIGLAAYLCTEAGYERVQLEAAAPSTPVRA